ncbi:MAG TPA: putative baseplate assembly protein [Opitutaceae bacterium]|nr:putative baseplate assembly protein [Opitutaceae bacterium]
MSTPTNDCGCCAGVTAQTPVEVTNRPGLSAVAYRVGTQSRFKQSMLAALSDLTRPALQRLKTRDDDDASIALLDAAATMADVLTFYQERIANESYLRTATERRSLLELARLIGYELRPGVAASTFLAFSLDTSPGAPAETPVPAGTKVQSIPGPNEKPQTFETIADIDARVAWNALTPQMTQVFVPQFGDTHVYLKGTSTNLKPGDAILLVGAEREADPGNENWDFRRVTVVKPDFDAKRTYVEWETGLGTTTPHFVRPAANPKVYALRQRAALFGYNAPQPASLSDQTLVHFSGQSATADWTFTLAAQSIDLDTTYPGILAQSWLVLARPDYTELYRVTSAVESARTGFTLAGKVTTCALDTTENLASFGGANLRGTMVFAQSEFLEMAESPITGAITGATVALAPAPTGLVKGQWLVASGQDSATGAAISEVVAVSSVDGTVLTVTPPLANSYTRASFALNANVAPATHGETVQEILGSGDASRAYQQFALKQPPLTYVSAATPSGAASTLAVRVNDLLWQEVPSLYGRGPQEHVYVTRTGDDGVTTVEFGDGVTGARLPTGQDNVRAIYRKGIGTEGLVKAGQLSLLLSRPLGVKSVLNPEAATGAQDRESLDDARTNAPLTVLTLDRTVSLQDYEDFARAFAGVAKALATWTWDGQMQRVFVTVAGPDGAAIAPDSATYRHLLEALQAAGDPFVSLRVQSYRPAYFRFAGKVKVDPAYQTSLVLAAVEQALRAQFSFAARAFGQPVMLSEVIAAVQAVPGVVAVTVDKLYRADELIALHPAASPPILLVKKGTVFHFGALSLLNARLLAALPGTLEDGSVAAAELLTLDPAPLEELGVMP